MSDILKTIITERLNDAHDASLKVPVETLQQQAASNTLHRSLIDQLSPGGEKDRKVRIIAELKKASPSAGLLCEDYNPVLTAREYELSGAVGISVLTEPRHFLGSDEDLQEVCNAVKLPVLRKDFICDPYQVYESAVLGADVILLIAAALDFHLLHELYSLALSIGLETIIEVHTVEELERVLPLAKGIIGVNSRNLRTLETDLSVAKELAVSIPPDRIAIAESGIKCRKDIDELQSLGYNGFLVGESLMRSGDISMELRTLMGQANQNLLEKPSEHKSS